MLVVPKVPGCTETWPFLSIVFLCSSNGFELSLARSFGFVRAKDDVVSDAAIKRHLAKNSEWSVVLSCSSREISFFKAGFGEKSSALTPLFTQKLKHIVKNKYSMNACENHRACQQDVFATGLEQVCEQVVAMALFHH